MGASIGQTAEPSVARTKPCQKPCNRCKPCAVGKLMFKTDEGPCPALQRAPDGVSVCGLVRDPARYAPMRARIKGVTVLRDAMTLLLAVGAPLEQGIKARKIWGIPNDATKSLIDRDRLVRIFHHIGGKLTVPTRLCVIGSAPGILCGQPGRQSPDIDVWGPASDYDEAELRHACREIGLELYGDGEKAGPDRMNYIEIVEKHVSVRIMERAYLQITEPQRGVVTLPQYFPVKVLGEYGSLTVTMPEPALLAAMKLARGNPQDIDDVNWWVGGDVWMTERQPDLDQIRAAIDTLPKPAKRDAATRNMVHIIPCRRADEVASARPSTAHNHTSEM